jgi:hypothetical protein
MSIDEYYRAGETVFQMRDGSVVRLCQSNQLVTADDKATIAGAVFIEWLVENPGQQGSAKDRQALLTGSFHPIYDDEAVWCDRGSWQIGEEYNLLKGRSFDSIFSLLRTANVQLGVQALADLISLVTCRSFSLNCAAIIASYLPAVKQESLVRILDFHMLLSGQSHTQISLTPTPLPETWERYLPAEYGRVNQDLIAGEKTVWLPDVSRAHPMLIGDLAAIPLEAVWRRLQGLSESSSPTVKMRLTPEVVDAVRSLLSSLAQRVVFHALMASVLKRGK